MILRTNIRTFLTLGVAATALLASPASAAAFQPEPGSEEQTPDAQDQGTEAAQDDGEIVVTARRTEETLQTVPGAVSAFGS